MNSFTKIFPKTLNVIDIEASGFGRESYPIEIGIVMADGTEYQTLVKPEPGWWHWDKSAQELHGISRPYLLKHGRAVAQICRDINAICAGATLYSDCWVHDSHWFNCLFTAAKMPSLARCTAIEYLLDDEQQRVYQATKKQVGARLGIPLHRALNDALIIQKSLKQLKGEPPRKHFEQSEVLTVAC